MRTLTITALLLACSPATPAGWTPDTSVNHVFWRRSAPGSSGECWMGHLHGKDSIMGQTWGNLTVYNPAVPGPAGQFGVRAKQGNSIGDWNTSLAAAGCP